LRAPFAANRLGSVRSVCDEHRCPRVNLLDRHIFKSVLFTCGAAVGLFVFVLMLGSAMKDLLGYVLAGQIDGWEALRLTLSLIPAVAPFALPPGILTGVLLTLGRLSADNEITAMRAAGISFMRLIRPILVFAVLGTALALHANFNAMPYARVQYEREFDEAKRTRPLSLILPKTFVRNFKHCVIYVGEKQDTLLRDLWIWKLDAEGRVRTLVRAESGRLDYDADANEAILTLTHALVEDRDDKNPENFTEAQRLASFDQYGPERLTLERLFGAKKDREKKLQWMTYAELQQEQLRLAAPTSSFPDTKSRDRAVMKVRLTVQDKINKALAVFSLALIGVPLGIKVSRRETSANLGVAVLLTLGYYMMTVMVGWLDRHPEYRPDLLLWLPNVVLIGLAVWLFGRIDRR
jgi:lipopolysaccharide export system permease protein